MASKKSGRSRAASGARALLAEYRRKRDFTKTGEPSGEEDGGRSAVGGGRGQEKRPGARANRRPPTADLQFVVQKHAASHLHYDFRLELDGVMKSWAVPKGPSLDPAVKRLAMEVEDHPIAYNTFEGTIPAGQYGGGTVMLWDRGTYGAAGAAEGGDEDTLRAGYEAGKLDFVMQGERLRGGFTLVRTRGRGGSKPQWLLVKRDDEFATPGEEVTADETTSIATGRTMDEITAGKRSVARRAAKGASARERAKKSTAKKSAVKSGSGLSVRAAHAENAEARSRAPLRAS